MPTAHESHLPRGLLSDDALPLYLRIAARLADDIAGGGARDGDRLPSERALAARYAVSRVTMRSALGELAARGMIEPSAARGWFLAATGATDGEAPSAFAADPAQGHTVRGFADYAREHRLPTHAKVLYSKVRPATVQEAERLRVGPGAALFEMRRLRYLDGLVVVVEHNRLPLALCPLLSETDFTTDSLFATLRRATPPQLPRVAAYSVEARQPDGEERELLEIDDGTPVLVATQLAFNQDSRPLELTVATYRGDRYRFQGSITD
ncbi:GntR family transcriptional regulator [Streptomyces montanisoli]|uniref:GntR family transcriptional regulator n=1 Tax=Streptomyces montanisoli TaxID=2798581 RepID=A0A940RU32_9ACTN|nr:GntR family transcriptional regulator [Streptomyces montanisoli]MBP0456801.1 GntR family transcriptional regulator [Streptomyces montanisoli]